MDAQRHERAAAKSRPRLPYYSSLLCRPMVPSPSGSGLDSGGILDVCLPGGSLAGLVDAAVRDGGLAELDDDELIGVLRAWRRLESWCSSGSLAAIAELARRRPAERAAAAASPGSFPEHLSEFIGDEIAAALTLTTRTADAYLGLALDLATRLPGTARALHEGVIDYPRARLIADLTRVLSDEDARAVEARILPAAGQQTTGRLRAAVGRAVLAIDPAAATKRREEAQKDPRVRRWQEDAGTAALGGYGLTRSAGSRPAPHRSRAGPPRARPAWLPGRATRPRLPGHPPRPRLHSPSKFHPSQDSGPGQGPRPAQGRHHLAARVSLTVPLLTQLGLAAEPGEVAGFGPVDPALARDLTTLAAADPAARFGVT